MTNYDIFISYKRKSLPTANNLYYRLITRGFSTFFDLEELGRDNFNTQLLNYIENAKDVFVILEEGSLDACKGDDWRNDWFCREIAYALEKRKNIIPILIGRYQMPPKEFFPKELQELSLKQSPEFSFSFFEAYIDKLIAKDYLLSKPNLQDKSTSVFKFYSDENCQVFKEGKLVCCLTGKSDEPYYLPILRKGDYRFKALNETTTESKIITEHIDSDEEKNIEILWNTDRQPIIEPKKPTTTEYTRKITFLGDTTWYAIKQPSVKIFANNIKVGEVPYKGQTTLYLKRETILLDFKSWGAFAKGECMISPDFEGMIKITSIRYSKKLSAELLPEKT